MDDKPEGVKKRVIVSAYRLGNSQQLDRTSLKAAITSGFHGRSEVDYATKCIRPLVSLGLIEERGKELIIHPDRFQKCWRDIEDWND